MPLPALTHWDETAYTLHRAAQPLGLMRSLCLPHVPNYLELAMKIEPEGLSTDLLPGGSEITLDFGRAALILQPRYGNATIIPLVRHSQKTLLEDLLAALKDGELKTILADAQDGALIDAVLAHMERESFPFIPGRAQIADESPLVLNVGLAADYARALYAIFTGIARFRARLGGLMTPVVVWPEHFDLSFLWFAGGEVDEHKPHMNFGFAPFTPGIERPYLYVYAHPYPENYEIPSLPAPARWETEAYTGVFLSYDHIAEQANPESYVEATCLTIFRALRPLLG